MTRRTTLLHSRYGDILQFSWDDPNPTMVVVSLIAGAPSMDIGKPALHPEHAKNRDSLELSRGQPPIGMLPEYARHIWEALANHEGWTMEPKTPVS